MNHLQNSTATALTDQFGRRVALRLTAGSTELPHEISERLRAARVQALMKRKVVALQMLPSAVPSDGQAVLESGDGGQGWWNRIASALPLIGLVVGLVAIHAVQNERRASEAAEVDAALLVDDLPPAAYADPGFVQFLKSVER